MSELDKLLRGFAPPPVPAGLAQRAAIEAASHAQETAHAPQRRRDRRGGWKRPLWIGAASFSLALTSAVAATVVSGGRIEIPVVQPVVQQVVEAVPALHRAQIKRAPRPVAEAAVRPGVEPDQTKVMPPVPGQPNGRRQRVVQTMTKARQYVEARRAAGLPTPRADRIERRAERIVERREAAGLPALTLEEVEAGLALRELRRMWLLRRTGRWDPSMLTEPQLARIAGRLPPEKRERFLALPPDAQRQLVAQRIATWRERRSARQVPAPPQDAPIEAENAVQDVSPTE